MSDPTAANFRTMISSCEEAVASGDYAVAKQYAARAEILLQGMVLETDHAGTSMKWRQSLAAVREAIASAESSSDSDSDTKRLCTFPTRF